MNKLQALFDQLRNLDPNDPGRWPIAIRIATVVHGLKRTGGKYGMVTMCIGTGMGAAGIIERL